MFIRYQTHGSIWDSIKDCYLYFSIIIIFTPNIKPLSSSWLLWSISIGRNLRNCKFFSWLFTLKPTLFFFNKVWLIYNVLPVYAAEQSDPVIYTHTHTHIPFLILSSIMIYPKRLGIIPCTVGPHCLSIF